MEPEKKFSTDFVVNSNGFKTNRDSWVYNDSREALLNNVSRMIAFYNNQREFYHKTKSEAVPTPVISSDPTKISWTVNLKKDMEKNNIVLISPDSIREAIYRPFNKRYVYTQRSLIERPGQFNEFFPTPQTKNLVICVSGIGVTKDFSVIITDIIPDFELIGKSQCFPLYYYESIEHDQLGLFDQTETDYIRRDGISDFVLDQARTLNPRISKEDVFYYIYGLLHSLDYRKRFSADLKKSLPHIPLPETFSMFKVFADAGRKLADLHLNYENSSICPSVIMSGLESNDFRVEKMRFPSKEDKRTIIYNSSIRVENIPQIAYEYVINGKSAIEWLMERYSVSINSESKIINDPNGWSENPRYIFDLLLRVIQMSIDSVNIIAKLPKLNLDC